MSDQQTQRSIFGLPASTKAFKINPASIDAKLTEETKVKALLLEARLETLSKSRIAAMNDGVIQLVCMGLGAAATYALGSAYYYARSKTWADLTLCLLPIAVLTTYYFFRAYRENKTNVRLIEQTIDEGSSLIDIVAELSNKQP